LILLLGALLAGISTAEDRQPNILFLFSDDQSFETIRALGHTDIDTPNLDRLVSGGTTFTHAYHMGSWNPAVCIASRSMLITGRSNSRSTGDERPRPGRGFQPARERSFREPAHPAGGA